MKRTQKKMLKGEIGGRARRWAECGECSADLRAGVQLRHATFRGSEEAAGPGCGSRQEQSHSPRRLEVLKVAALENPSRASCPRSHCHSLQA